MLVGGAVALAGCGSSADETTSEPQATVPTGKPDVEPADRPGRRAPPVGDGSGGVRLEELGQFDGPVFLTQAAGDEEHLFVVEQCGRVLRVPAGGGSSETFLDVSELITCGGEQGLLSVAFDPAYERSGLFYVYYTDTGGDTRIVEYRRSREDPARADPATARELLRIGDFASNHNGGLLLFGPDGLLYTGTGDGGGGGDPERTSQDLSSLLGKLLRIDPRAADGEPYSIPADNPHVDDEDARGEIVAHGLRNPWRFSFDRETGDLWIGDVGQDALEEVNAAGLDELAVRGESLDFGWSAFEGSVRFNEDQKAPDAVDPVLEYGRDGGCSVTGGYVVRDPELSSLYGRYLYGDFCAGELRSFTANSSQGGADDRPLGLQVAQLSSFGEDSAGRIYAASLDGPVYRLVPEGG